MVKIDKLSYIYELCASGAQKFSGDLATFDSFAL